TLASQIVADPTFHGVTGTFDRAYFNQLLRSAGLTEDAYMAEQKAAYIRSQIGDALTGGLVVPDSYMRALHEYRNEARAISMLKMAPTDLAKPDEVSDEDAKKVYDQQLATTFTTPERRKVEQIVFTDKADADKAAAALAAGKTFDDLMAERNLKPTDVDLGLVSRDKIVDPALADA